MKHWNWHPNERVNFGDELGAYILRKLGYEIEGVEDIEDAELISVGSILDNRLPDHQVTILGTGLGGGGRIKDISKHRILAVRGVVTRNAYNLPEDTPLGDLAILLPRIYEPKNIGGTGVVYVPHMDTFYGDIAVPPLVDVVLNTMSDDLEHSIDVIANAKMVISTSLHGYIVAKAYGVPVLAAPYPNQNMSKWLDKWVDFDSIFIDKTLEERQDELLKVIEEKL